MMPPDPAQLTQRAKLPAAPTAAAVRAKVIETLGDSEKAKRWIAMRSRTCGGVRRELLKSAQGRRDVMTELERIDHGIPA